MEAGRHAKPTPARLALQMLTPRRAPRGIGLWIDEARRHAFASGGERISVLQVGEAPYVLFVHGLGGAAADFASRWCSVPAMVPCCSICRRTASRAVPC